MSQPKNIKELFQVIRVLDQEYAVIEYETNRKVFTGSIEEVNAWLDVYKKGFKV